MPISHAFPISCKCRITKEEIGNDTSHIAICQNSVECCTAYIPSTKSSDHSCWTGVIYFVEENLLLVIRFDVHL